MVAEATHLVTRASGMRFFGEIIDAAGTFDLSQVLSFESLA